MTKELMQVFSYNAQEVRVVMVDGEPWFVATDEKSIGKVLTNGGIQNLTLINKQGMHKLVLTSRKMQTPELAIALGIDIINAYCVNKEQTTIGIIIAAFKHLRHDTQYRVGPYFVDLYFPEYKIAIECDEYNHAGYDLQREYDRQTYIERETGCIFIRYSPDALGFNIGDVINQILLLVMKYEV